MFAPKKRLLADPAVEINLVMVERFFGHRNERHILRLICFQTDMANITRIAHQTWLQENNLIIQTFYLHIH